MIIGFSKHYGAGGSGPALDYLTGYLVNGQQRDPRPEVVRGDPKTVAGIIDALPFKRRYTSGVLSFAADDEVTPEAQEDIMNRFEGAVFASIPADRRSIVWIKHRDKGRTELHFVVPRVDLGTRKSLNIAPPTPASRDLIDTLRTAINLRYGFRDPNDPACAQSVSVPTHVAKLAAQAKRLARSAKIDIRQAITDRLIAQARAGRITGRAGVVGFLMNEGFTVVRAGVNYLSVVCPESGERVRLKGNIYREHFRPQDLQPIAPRHDPARLLAVDRRLERLVEMRAAYHRTRYEINERNAVALHTKEELSNDRTRNTPAPCRGANRSITPGAQPTIRDDAEQLSKATRRFGDANHRLGDAGQRLGQAHRTFAQHFDEAIANVVRDERTLALIQRYSAGVTQAPSQENEMELEFLP